MELFGLNLQTDNFYFLLLAILFIILIAFTIYQAVIWTILPFSVFGIKPLLKKVIEQQEKIEKILREGLTLEQAKGEVGDKKQEKIGERL